MSNTADRDLAPPASAPAQSAAAQPPRDALLLASDDLLRGRRMVEISHNGEIYRLQSTRQNKLILTK